MSDFVRVWNKAINADYSVRHPDLTEVTVIDEPADDANGRPLPATPHAPVAATATAKKKTPTNGDVPATTPEEGSA